MINECSFAVSTNESRPVYTGTLFEIENNILTMVSSTATGWRCGAKRSRATAMTAASSCPARR